MDMGFLASCARASEAGKASDDMADFAPIPGGHGVHRRFFAWVVKTRVGEMEAALLCGAVLRAGFRQIDCADLSAGGQVDDQDTGRAGGAGRAGRTITKGQADYQAAIRRTGFRDAGTGGDRDSGLVGRCGLGARRWRAIAARGTVDPRPVYQCHHHHGEADNDQRAHDDY